MSTRVMICAAKYRYILLWNWESTESTSVECRSHVGNGTQSLRLVTTPPYWATLAGFLSESCTSWASWCSTACVVKSLRTCGIVPTSCRCGITATSPICHPTAPSRTVPSTQLLRPMGVLCGWSVGLEFPAGQLAESGYWREQFQTISEDVSVRNVLMHSAH